MVSPKIGDYVDVSIGVVNTIRLVHFEEVLNSGVRQSVVIMQSLSSTLNIVVGYRHLVGREKFLPPRHQRFVQELIVVLCLA